jgi:hypothetical protein
VSKRFFFRLLLLGSISGTLQQPYGEACFKPNHPCIRYTGRVDMQNPLCTRFDWSYITIEALFEGTSCSIGLKAVHDIYNVFIDGEFSERISIDTLSGRYTVASGLSDSVHHLLITKRYETDRHVTECTGLYLDSGRQLLPLPPRPPYRIEFIGASTLLGYGNESLKSRCDSVSNLSNTYASYGPVTARLLGAECSVLAITRRGLVRNYHSPFMTSFKPFSFYYRSTLWTNPHSPVWNCTAWVPQVIVITLGINDFSTPPHPTQPLFSNHAYALIRDLYQWHPGVHIVFLSPSREPLQSYMSAFVERERREGNTRISFLAYEKFPDWHRGCDWHPNVKAHRKIAEQLAAHIKPLLETVK